MWVYSLYAGGCLLFVLLLFISETNSLVTTKDRMSCRHLSDYIFAEDKRPCKFVFPY